MTTGQKEAAIAVVVALIAWLWWRKQPTKAATVAPTPLQAAAPIPSPAPIPVVVADPTPPPPALVEASPVALTGTFTPDYGTEYTPPPGQKLSPNDTSVPDAANPGGYLTMQGFYTGGVAFSGHADDDARLAASLASQSEAMN